MTDSKKTTAEKPSNKKLNLHQKLIEIRKAVPYLKKGADGYKFKYVSGGVLLGLLRPKMDELGVLLSYDIEEMTNEEIERQVVDKYAKTSSNVMCCRVKMKFTFSFTDADDPSSYTRRTLWFQGIGDDIQDIGKYNTYALRYFLLGFFNIPTDEDDPDAFENKKAAALPAELISSEQLKSIEDLINGHEDIRQRMVNFYKSLTRILAVDYESVVGTINNLIKSKEKNNG